MKYLITILGLAACIATASAQSYTEIVWDQIQKSYDYAAQEGFNVKNYVIGAIDEGEDNTWTFYFSSSYDYRLQAFCDEDCSDIDLYLKDEYGNAIDEDTEEDDYPVISFSPTKSGTYKIEVTMYSCSNEPCYFGLAMFRK
jgi:hypothetical protein